jgi:hypothetical protein
MSFDNAAHTLAGKLRRIDLRSRESSLNRPCGHGALGPPATDP